MNCAYFQNQAVIAQHSVPGTAIKTIRSIRTLSGRCDASTRRMLVVIVMILFWAGGSAMLAATNSPPAYEFRAGSPDGLGKWYLGREIAHYMGHQAAPWLERAEREDEERPSRLMTALELKAGQTVADVGAGSGYLTWRLAAAVGARGRVYATDIQPEMLVILRTNMAQRGLTNVTPVLGGFQDPHLPEGAIDLILLVDVYHEFDHPYEMTMGMVRALKPGGRLVLVEYRAEEPWIPIKPLHKLSEAQVRKELALHALAFVTNRIDLPRQHILVFRKTE